jgi:hypothetical protein
MTYKSDIYNWIKGGPTSKETYWEMATRTIGFILAMIGAYMIHPGAAVMVFGLILSFPSKKE